MIYLGHVSIWFLILMFGVMFGKIRANILGLIFWSFVVGIPSTVVHTVFFGGL